MKKLIIIIVGFILIVAAVFVSPVIYNDILFYSYKKSITDNLSNSKLEYEIVDSRMGILWGNSNHLDMEFIISIKTKMEAENLYTLTNSFNLISPFSKNNNCFIYKYSDNKVLIFSNNSWHEDELFDNYTNEKIIEYSSSSSYMIEYADQTRVGFSMWDLRAH